MKVLLVTQDYPPRPGGMARYYADWGRELGTACRVLAGSWDGAPPHAQGDERLEALPFDMAASHRFANLLRVRRRIARAVAADRPHVLVAGNVRPFAPPLLGTGRRLGLPVAVVYHGNDLLRAARRWADSWWSRRRWVALLGGPALHVVNSAFTAGEAERLGLPPDRIAVARPEVDGGRFRPAADAAERAETRAALSLPAETPLALFVGRLVPRKGIATALDALAALDVPAHLAVAGPGDVERWAAEARARGVHDRITFLGAVSEAMLPRLYRAADLFVAPSHADLDADDVEGFGIVYLEAAASGLAVLAARTGGVAEAVADGESGILVPPRDPAALAAAWSALLRDPQRRAGLGSAGRRRVERSFDRGSSGRALLAALARIPA